MVAEICSLVISLIDSMKNIHLLIIIDFTLELIPPEIQKYSYSMYTS